MNYKTREEELDFKTRWKALGFKTIWTILVLFVWLILMVGNLVFEIYNAIKQFPHYVSSYICQIVEECQIEKGGEEE